MNKHIGRKQLIEKIQHLNKQISEQKNNIAKLTDLLRGQKDENNLLMDRLSEMQKELIRLTTSPSIGTYDIPRVQTSIDMKAFYSLDYASMAEDFVDVDVIKHDLAEKLVDDLLKSDYIQFDDCVYTDGDMIIPRSRVYTAKLYAIPWYKAYYNKKIVVKNKIPESKTMVLRATNRAEESSDRQ